ncbi:hypothetical protein JW905_06730 [bacterium]|nr:hypothetical protein [candidate division CSSED10-310 bacterium]
MMNSLPLLPLLSYGMLGVFVLLAVELIVTVRRLDGRVDPESGSTVDGELLISPFVLDLDKDSMGSVAAAVHPDHRLPASDPVLVEDVGFVVGDRHVITHTDFDGLVSGAMLLRALGQGIAISFAGPRWLAQRLTSLVGRCVEHDAVYITDLGVSGDTIADILSALGALRARGVNIYWYDHHEWEPDHLAAVNELCRDLIVDVSFKTAAEIVRRRLIRNDSHADKLVLFLKGVTRNSDPDWDASWRDLLSELQRHSTSDIKLNAMNKLAFNKDLGLADRLLIRRGRKRERLTRAAAEARHPRFETSRGLNFIVIDVRSFRYEMTETGARLYVIQRDKPAVTIGRLACERHGADFCLVLWRNNRYSIYRGINPRVDFGPLLGERRFGGTTYHIAGHRYAAGITTKLRFLHILKSVFLWDVPGEVNQLIGFLQSEY